MAQLGLSDPLIVQYLRWIGDIARGSFGHSFFRAESVAEMISRRGPLTAEIALMSVTLSWVVGIPVAILSALRPNSIGDNITRFISILFLAVPGFWFGMLIVLAALFWFGYRAPLSGASLLANPWDNLQIVIGPAVVLGVGQAAYIARVARPSPLEVIREDYVRPARAKGPRDRAAAPGGARTADFRPGEHIIGVLGLHRGPDPRHGAGRAADRALRAAQIRFPTHDKGACRAALFRHRPDRPRYALPGH